MTDLKPCPFCGGEAHTHDFSWHASQFAGHMFAKPYWQVICGKCRAAIGDFDTRAEAIAAWNARAEHGTLTAEQVRKAIFNGSSYASYDGAKYYADGISMQAIADELNSRAERTCECVAEYAKSPIDGETIVLHRCSECHELMRPLMHYCSNCGAKVVSE